ncbi:helix-turn-helix domain-containing protein [Microbacterium hominis]|uniref:helix-turn-helix transcriptional regulator n=1 Tax=Microbacterium TaxID=33882 RepID=UPI00168BC072|nr:MULTISPECIES: helix-turn-helix transcriptional regulator [Microbacterium]QOC26765.1 helix-turn-helix domain-containing protein [Microbacterium hominis]QOC27943.1 helix-turn-helix domain-containing protein [Microbacterium hominis]QYF96907.1 helix-turn-helix transcriptional regulator [Microbacterium sp. PAMC21962]
MTDDHPHDVRDDGRQQRRELGSFLRRQRERLDRSTYGLPPAGRGRTTGLRREEVSYLSGVSVTWYTWLEQGRDIHPSRQVLDAVATALRLTDTEHDYVLSLVGLAPRPAVRAGAVDVAPAHVQRFLDALDEHPAYALAPDWGITGWNRAYERLYPGVATTTPEDRNLLWLVFTDPSVRSLLDDWDDTSRRFLAEFRAEAGPRLGDPRYRDLVARLSAASDDFRARWNEHGVSGFRSRERVFRHPALGRLVFEHHQLRPSDETDLQLVVYVADAETRTRFHGSAS